MAVSLRSVYRSIITTGSRLQQYKGLYLDTYNTSTYTLLQVKPLRPFNASSISYSSPYPPSSFPLPSSPSLPVFGARTTHHKPQQYNHTSHDRDDGP
jgi:hypothetical protein